MSATACGRGQCEGKLRAAGCHDGTIWECDECGSEWGVRSGA